MPVRTVLEPVGGGLRGERADRGVVGSRVSALRRAQRRAELLDEVVIELVDDDEALGGVAGLAGVVEPSFARGLDRCVEILGAEHDERVRAAELEHDLLQVAPGDLGDRGTGPLRAGDRDAVHPRVGDHPLDLLVRGVDVLVGPRRETGVVEDLLNRLGGFGALRRML
jgi:hypothetical protein